MTKVITPFDFILVHILCIKCQNQAFVNVFRANIQRKIEHLYVHAGNRNLTPYMYWVWSGPASCLTMDIDLLGKIDNSFEMIVYVLKNV